MKNKKVFKKLLLYVIAVGLGIAFLSLVVISFWIGFSVKKECQKAQQEYGGDCVKALSAFVEDEKHSFKERNSAVWALGQLGDQLALAVLNKYYTGEPCQHDKFLCQYELKKAIKLTEGGFNITALFWHVSPRLTVSP